MKKTNILFLVPAICRSGGGVSEVVRLVSNELHSTGLYNVEVVAFDSPYYSEDLKGWYASKIRTFSILGPKRFGFSPGMLLYLFKSKPDIIHVHGLWMFHCLAMYIVSFFSNVKYFVTPHGMLEPWIIERRSMLKKVIGFSYQNNFLKRSSGVQALTANEVNSINSIVKGVHTYVVPNFSIGSSPVDDKESAPADCNKNKISYLYFGRIHSKKGCLNLLRAWNKLSSIDANFAQRANLVFAGWIDGDNDFLSLLEDVQKKNSNVSYVGPVYGQNKTSLFLNSDFLILPSFSEGLPMVVIEAWSHHLPVLMTRECNLADSFLEGAAIEISTSPDLLVKGLTQTFELTSTELIQFRLKSYRYFIENFSKSIVLEKLQAMYGVDHG